MKWSRMQKMAARYPAARCLVSTLKEKVDMDASAIRGALGELQLGLEKAREAKRQIESEYTGARIEGGAYEFPEVAFAAFLNEL